MTENEHTSTYFELAEPIIKAKLKNKPARVISKFSTLNPSTENPIITDVAQKIAFIS